MFIILVFISAMVVALLDSITEYIVISLKKREEALIISVIDWLITAILFYFILKQENFVIYVLSGSLGFGIGNFYATILISRWKRIKKRIKSILRKGYVNFVNIIKNVTLKNRRWQKMKK